MEEFNKMTKLSEHTIVPMPRGLFEKGLVKTSFGSRLMHAAEDLESIASTQAVLFEDNDQYTNLVLVAEEAREFDETAYNTNKTQKESARLEGIQEGLTRAILEVSTQPIYQWAVANLAEDLHLSGNFTLAETVSGAMPFVNNDNGVKTRMKAVQAASKLREAKRENKTVDGLVGIMDQVELKMADIIAVNPTFTDLSSEMLRDLNNIYFEMNGGKEEKLSAVGQFARSVYLMHIDDQDNVFYNQTTVHRIEDLMSTAITRNTAFVDKAIEVGTMLIANDAPATYVATPLCAALQAATKVEDAKQRANIYGAISERLEAVDTSVRAAFATALKEREGKTDMPYAKGLVYRVLSENQEEGAPLMLQFAKALRDSGDNEGCVDLCVRIGTSDPTNVHAHYFAATAQEAMGNLELAGKHAKEIMNLSPGHTSGEAIYNRVTGELRQRIETGRREKDQQSVVDACSMWLRFDPDNHHAHYFAGTAHEALGDVPNAITHYRAAGEGSSAKAGLERVGKILL